MFILKDADTNSQNNKQSEIVKKLAGVFGVIIGVQVLQRVLKV